MTLAELGAPRRAIDPAPLRLAAAAVASGVALDVGLRGQPANLAVAAGCGAVLVALLADGRVTSRPARACVALAVLPLAFLGVRASPWLLVSNLGVAGLLLAAGVLHARSGSPLDTTLRRMLGRLRPAVDAAVRALGLLRPLVPANRSFAGLAGVARGAAIALPLVVVLVALLASADAVFAGFVSPELDPGPAVGHVVAVVLLAAVALAVVASAAGEGEDELPAGRFGVAEVVTMLVLAALVLGLFVVAQLVGATDAGRRLVEDSGLTPAEHARQGFFQLCFATAAVVVHLGVVRAVAAPGVVERRAVRWLSAAVPVLGLGLVAVSLRRMALYDEAFGLTMLRLWVVGAALWLGGLLVMLAVRNAGVGRRSWVPAGAVASALVLVLVADVANPEALVARHNLRRADVDHAYLRSLSADAGIPGTECPEGVGRWNLAVARAC